MSAEVKHRLLAGRAFARLSLLGNPSDGFGGKTLSVTIRDFSATAQIGGEPEGATAHDGVRRLVEATRTRFCGHCLNGGAPAGGHDGLRVETDIPMQVGLGGSSAIVIATMRALGAYHGVELDPAELAEIALAIEVEDLGIAAGLQDRVAQAYEGLVYMDFGPGVADRYERLDAALLPPLFVAYDRRGGESSTVVHTDLRGRFERDEGDVRAVMTETAAIAERGRKLLLAGERRAFSALLGENFEARTRLVELDPRHVRMIEIARSLGAPANYAGSGGAIVGALPPEVRIAKLRAAFEPEGFAVVEPQLG